LARRAIPKALKIQIEEVLYIRAWIILELIVLMKYEKII